MGVPRKEISFAQQISIDRQYNPYIMGGCWNPFDRGQGTDCSDCGGKNCAASRSGTAMPWARQVSTESWRPPSLGGNADVNNGPYGSIMVDSPNDYPADAAVLIALHHGDGSAADSHMWVQVDKLKIETHGSSDQFPNGATVLNDGVNFHDDVLDVHDVDGADGGQYGANNWWYIPGPIIEDGTPIPTKPSEGPPVTLYGVDVANVNFGGADNPNLPAVTAFVNALPGEGFAWLEFKATQGSDFTDPCWATALAAATAIGFPIVAYHYVDGSDPTAQAANAASVAGANRVGWMLDGEQGMGDIGNFQAVLAAFQAAGLTVVIDYLPKWYLQQIGSPTLTGVPGLVSSAYPGGAGYASTLYDAGGGDQGEGWQPYDGETPVVWQFTDQAVVAGISVDADAFVGSQSDLLALIVPNAAPAPAPAPNPNGSNTPTPTPAPIPDPSDVPLTNAQWQDLYNWTAVIFQQVAGVVPNLPAVLLPGSPTPFPAVWPLSLQQLLGLDQPAVPGSVKIGSMTVNPRDIPPAPPRRRR